MECYQGLEWRSDPTGPPSARWTAQGRGEEGPLSRGDGQSGAIKGGGEVEQVGKTGRPHSCGLNTCRDGVAGMGKGETKGTQVGVGESN